MEKRHRIFVAINLPEDIKRQLEKYQQNFALNQNTEWAKWTKKDNLHITLEFLGYLTDEEIGEVCMAVKEVAERHEAFSVNLTSILYGPPGKMPPRMVWVEGEKSKELANLRKDLEEALTKKVSFIPENRGFASHITLARIFAFAWKAIEPEERPEINQNIDLAFTAESIEVMESESKRGGPAYTVLESHSLK